MARRSIAINKGIIPSTIFADREGAGVLIRGVEQTIPHIAYIARNGFATTLTEQEANARLIAAAPALYEALRNIAGVGHVAAPYDRSAYAHALQRANDKLVQVVEWAETALAEVK